MSNRQAATRAAVTKITFDRAKGLFKKCVGKKRGADGKLRARIFWLGPVQHEAIQKARIYQAVWAEVTDHELEGWSPEFEQEAERRIKGAERWAKMVAEAAAGRIGETLEVADRLRRIVSPAIPAVGNDPVVGQVLPAAPSSPVATAATDDMEAAVVTLYAALDEYNKAMQQKPLSPSYKSRIAETIKDLKHYRSDRALAEIDRVWLEQLTDYIKSRPNARIKHKKKKKPAPLAPLTVKTLLQHWRQAFDWIDRASDSPRFGGWEAPKRMNELFAVDLNQIRTKQERDKAADGPEQLTVPEIKKLIHAGNNRERMLMLMGLFCGMGQTELRWCRRDEFNLDTARFKHRRNKTGQRGEWFLPDELVALLRTYFEKVEPLDDGSAFSTREGQPLVTESSDSVRQWFDDVRRDAEIMRPGVTFYAFRRFLGDRAKRKGGIDLRDAALAHAGNSVGDKHYSNFRDFGKVQELGRDLYAELKLAKVFDWPRDRQTTHDR